MIYFNNRNGSFGLTRRLILRLFSATAIYGRWNSSLCWKGRWYPTITSMFSESSPSSGSFPCFSLYSQMKLDSLVLFACYSFLKEALWLLYCSVHDCFTNHIYHLLSPLTFWSSRLRLQNTLTASLQRGYNSHNECPRYITLNKLMLQ